MTCSGPVRVITGADILRYQKLSSQVVTWRKNKYSADFREEPVLSERTVQLSPSLETPKIQKKALPLSIGQQFSTHLAYHFHHLIPLRRCSTTLVSCSCFAIRSGVSHFLQQ